MLIVRPGRLRRSSRSSGCELMRACRGERDVRAAAAAILPGAGERGQRCDRRVGGRGAGVALGAHAEAQESGSRGGELAPHSRYRLGVHPTDRRALLHARAVQLRQQLVVPVCVLPAPVLVVEAGVDDRPHHPDRQRGVGARQRAQMLVRHPRGAAAERIDHHEPRALLARVEQLSPQVRRRGERVPAPHQQIAGVRPLLRVHLGRDPVSHRGAHVAGGRADRALQVRGAESVHHAGGHDVPLDQPLRSHVAVRQDRLAPELVARAQQPLRRDVDRLLPGGAPEVAVLAHERVQDALVRVHALEVVRDLAAEEADRDRMVGIARDLRRAPVLDRHVHGAGVGTVVRAGAADEGHAAILRRV